MAKRRELLGRSCRKLAGACFGQELRGAGKPAGILSSTCTHRLSLQLDQTQIFQDLQPGVLSGSRSETLLGLNTPWPRWPRAETRCVLPVSRAGTSVSPEKLTQERARRSHWMYQEQLVPESLPYPMSPNVLPYHSRRACQDQKPGASPPPHPRPALNTT